MDVVFKQTYLKELYTDGKCSDKQHRYQPQIVKKYIRVIDLMKVSPNYCNLQNMVRYIMNTYKGIKRGFLQSE